MKENRRIELVLHFLAALLVALVLYIGLKPLVDVPQWVLLLDSLLSGVLVSALLVLLKFTVRYSYFSLLDTRQKMINYISLALLFLICWIGLNFLILYYVVEDKDWSLLVKTIPLRISMGLLIYILSVQFFSRLFSTNNDCAEIIEEVTNEEANPLEEENINSIVERIERVTVKNGSRIEIIPVGEIIHLQGEGDYVRIFSTKGKFLKEQTMKSLENTLPPEQFVRVHRSNIVNIDFIAQIELYDKQTQILKLKDGTQVKVSLAGYKLLKNTLGL